MNRKFYFEIIAVLKIDKNCNNCNNKTLNLLTFYKTLSDSKKFNIALDLPLEHYRTRLFQKKNTHKIANFRMNCQSTFLISQFSKSGGF